MKTTIKDIASMAGVSVSTVSRALNDTGPVDEATRQRILDLSKRLDYRPSAMARSLVTQRTMTIMLLVPDVANNFFAEIVQDFSITCREKGYKVFLGDTINQPGVEAEYLNMVKEGVVDGAVLVPMTGDDNMELYYELAKNRFPLVMMDRVLERIRSSFVIVDNIHGGNLVAQHFLQQGHQYCGYIGGDITTVQAFRDRHHGYAQTLLDNGISLSEDYVYTDCPSPDQGAVDGIKKLMALPKPPTAVFADNDLTAIACIATLRQMGYRVPDDVAVVGYDNINISSFVDVPLSTVAQPKREIAQQAMKLVLNQIKARGEDNELPLSETVLKPELILRASA